jgi:hypothetical protein
LHRKRGGNAAFFCALSGWQLLMLLPGIKTSASPTDHVPVDQMQFMRFNARPGSVFGGAADGEVYPSEVWIPGSLALPAPRNDGHHRCENLARAASSLKIS